MRLFPLVFLLSGLHTRAFKYHYGSYFRKQIKERYKIRGLVEDHHIIPKEFKRHPIIIIYEYNLSEPKNIMLMPNVIGKQLIKTNRPIHSGGHIKYNKYVSSQLSKIKSKEDLNQLVIHLKKSLLQKDLTIPWK
jgi:hypothetical protein